MKLIKKLNRGEKLMAKDPAVLFYYEAFMVGTQYMSDECVGKYIRLLCYQFDKGHIPLELVLSICKANEIPMSIKAKLKVDENGLYYNERADLEKEKRVKFVASRKHDNSLAKHKVITSSSYDEHDINRNINRDISKILLNEIVKRKPDFKLPNLDKWATDIDLMVRIDKRPIEEIKKVILWCQKDTFWQNNILSTSKLRKQFDQLSLKMKGEANNANTSQGFSTNSYRRNNQDRGGLRPETEAELDRIAREYNEHQAKKAALCESEKIPGSNCC
jgi:hypothetical protein